MIEKLQFTAPLPNNNKHISFHIFFKSLYRASFYYIHIEQTNAQFIIYLLFININNSNIY